MSKAKSNLPSTVIDLDSLSFKHDEISKQKTSPLYVQKREGPGGRTLEYVDEGYMRQILNTHYPLWSWEMIKYEFLGKEAVAVHGRLTIIDNGVPRSFDALAAHRIALLKSSGNFVDLGNDMKSANTEAFKVACNRLCNIADDVYRKSILSEEQVDTLEGTIGLLDGATRRKVKESVGNNTINPSNFDSTMEKLYKIINNEKESE
jgi:hypothetical protein|tara:strand:+ start:3317 stop:3931 length:615 start_codon:yes stop_codon:yes gene_type:complete